MKSSNAEIRSKVLADTPIFQAARRSDITIQLRTKMCEKGLRNVDLAERLGVSEANISRWLRGNQNLSLDTIYQLADAIEVPLCIEVGAPKAVAIDWPMQSSEAEYHPSIETAKSLTLSVNEFNVQNGNVVSMAAYAKVRSRTHSIHCGAFAAARSEYGIVDFDEKMVN
jgi:transcriptional regulator with XRE-family HTH domain